MFHRFIFACLLALVAAVPISVRAVVAPGSAGVVAVQPTPTADLVLLNRGFDAGLRQGMVCRVTRAGREIAEVLLVEIRPSSSAALISSVAPSHSIRPGDVANIKVLKS